MNEDDIIYGVGESNRGINKNIGMHRYGGIWTGDNKSWWFHILLNLKMMPSLNMCGFLYTGADLGGFGKRISAAPPGAWCIYPADARK